MPVTTSTPSVPWAADLDLSVYDVTAGAGPTFPVEGEPVSGTIDLTDDAPQTECVETHGIDLNTQECKVNGLWNGCSLERGCEAVMLTLTIEQPSLDGPIGIDWALIAPNGEKRIQLSHHIDEHGGDSFPMQIPTSANSYADYQWTFYVGETPSEIWESGTYEVRMVLGDLEGNTWQGQATFDVKTDESQQPQQKQPDDSSSSSSSPPSHTRTVAQNATKAASFPVAIAGTAVVLVAAGLGLVVTQLAGGRN